VIEPCVPSIFPLWTESKSSSSSSRPGTELVNTVNDLKVTTLVNGSIVNFTAMSLTCPSFRIRTLVNGSDIQSVQFGLDGRPNHKIENMEPYFLCGNRGRDAFKCRRLGNGNHTVTATPYDSRRAQGVAGKSATVSFAIVRNMVVAAPTATASAPFPAPQRPLAPTVAIPSVPALPVTVVPVSGPNAASRPVAPGPSSPAIWHHHLPHLWPQHLRQCRRRSSRAAPCAIWPWVRRCCSRDPTRIQWNAPITLVFRYAATWWTAPRTRSNSSSSFTMARTMTNSACHVGWMGTVTKEPTLCPYRIFPGAETRPLWCRAGHGLRYALKRSTRS
jgi:hypothetical protein